MALGFKRFRVSSLGFSGFWVEVQGLGLLGLRASEFEFQCHVVNEFPELITA